MSARQSGFAQEEGGVRIVFQQGAVAVFATSGTGVGETPHEICRSDDLSGTPETFMETLDQVSNCGHPDSSCRSESEESGGCI